MKKRLLALLITCMSIMMVGCSQGGASDAESATATEVSFPTKPVKVIIPYGAGGGTDLTGRVAMQEMGTILGESFNVENIAGASGTVGATSVANAAADGYTLLFTPTDPMATQPNLLDVPYDLDDFVGIAGFTSETSVIAVRTDSPWESLDDFLAEAGSGNVFDRGHSGIGGVNHTCLELFFEQVDIETRDVPFDGGAVAIAALLGGHVDLVAGTAGAMVPYIESGEIRILGVASAERLEAFQDVPTFTEKGIDVVVGVEFFLVAPKDTPTEIVAILEKAAMEAGNSEAFMAFAAERRQELNVRTGEEIMTKTQSDYDMYNKLFNQ